MKECPRCKQVKTVREFRDTSLVTGYGRFCKSCKKLKRTLPRYSLRTLDPYYKDEGAVQAILTRSELNKLSNFIKEPEKYARNTEAAKQKVRELDKLVSKMSEGQRAGYVSAKNGYKTELERRQTVAGDDKNIKEKVKKAVQDHLSMAMRYKGVTRTVYPYAHDDTYCVAFCTYAVDLRTFRLDRMKAVRLGERFDFKGSLQKEAEGKLTQAPLFRRKY